MANQKINIKKRIVPLIVGLSYAIYLLLANYVFDELIMVKGESKLQNLPLSTETNDIEFSIDEVKETKKQWKELIQISGWGFIKRKGTNNNKVFVVLKSKENTYIFDTVMFIRQDIVEIFSDPKLGYSGFLALFSKNLIKDGIYNIGIFIKNYNNNSLIFTDKYVFKQNGKLYNRFVSELYQIKLPDETKRILFNFERVQQLSNGGNEFIELEGWAFGEAQNTDNQQVYVVLKSDNDTYIYDTVSRKRPDVTNCYKRLKLNLDNSGFLAAIPKDELKRGKYEIGIYLKKDDVELLQYSGKTVTI